MSETPINIGGLIFGAPKAEKNASNESGVEKPTDKPTARATANRERRLTRQSMSAVDSTDRILFYEAYTDTPMETPFKDVYVMTEFGYEVSQVALGSDNAAVLFANGIGKVGQTLPPSFAKFVAGELTDDDEHAQRVRFFTTGWFALCPKAGWCMSVSPRLQSKE